MPSSKCCTCVRVHARELTSSQTSIPNPGRKKNAGSGLVGFLFTVGRMNVPLRLLTAAHLFCAAAGALRVSLERQLLEEEISSGRRTCRLYCRVGIGFHLQIHPDGRVNGSHEPNQLSKSRDVGNRRVGNASDVPHANGARSPLPVSGGAPLNCPREVLGASTFDGCTRACGSLD